MRTLTVVLSLTFFVLFLTTFGIPAHAQQDGSSATSNNNDRTVEGTLVSSTRQTLVVRTDSDQFQLFTYNRGEVTGGALAPGARVRVTASGPDDNGTRDASNVAVVTPASSSSGVEKGAQAAPVPEKVRDVEADIRRESRRWRMGARVGAAFNPELFSFGVQSQMGPIFHPRILFRPNAEFAFGEVTDLIALNFEGIYRFSGPNRRGNWTPYVGAGPAMIFIHQSYQQGRDISFGNFDYETGLNVLAGMQHRRGMFVELKTSLYSGPAPKLRLVFGYNF